MIDWRRAEADELSPEAREYLELLLREEGVDLDESEGSIAPGGAAGIELSFAQQRLWFLAQLEPESPVYNVPAALRLTGSLYVAALARSLGEVVQRHEVLRTAIHTVEGKPLAEAAPADEPFRIPVVDLSGLTLERRLAEAGRLADREALRPFDLAQDPLLRGTLVVLEPAEHLALLNMHHIVSDGWSVGVLVREMGALYEAFRRGRPSPLPPLPIQYADFAAWQRRRLTGELLELQLAYWRGRLAGAPPVTPLPTDRPRPPVRSLRGARRPLSLPAPLGEAVDALGLAEGATPFMTLVAAVAAWLHRHGAGSDLVLGSPIANRTRAEIEGLIGFFANTIVLRIDLGGNPTWCDLLARVREATLGAYEHQDLPFERIVEELVPERDLSYNPLFQVAVALQNAPVPALSLAGLTLDEWGLELSTARFDLALDLQEERRWTGHIEYATDLFDAATVERMAGHLAGLVRGVAADPNRRLSELPLLSPAERHQLFAEWNDTAAAPAGGILLHGLFEAQAAAVPNAPAAVFAGETLTYAELDARADRLARRLRELGCGPESRVGVALERSLDLVVALLGVLKAGAAYVPLDPDYPHQRLAFVLEDAAPRVLVTTTPLLAALPPPLGMIVCLDGEPIDGSPIDRESGEPAPGDDRRLAYVLFTSGSTGRPKGVAVSHQTLVNFLRSMRRAPGFVVGQRLLAVTSLAFDIAALEIFLPLTTGGCVELTSRAEAADGVLLASRLETSGAGMLQATPATWRMLLAAGWTGDPGLAALCGGEALPRDLAASLAARTSELWNLYGPTETTVWSAAVRIRPDECGPVSIGRPIAATRIHLLDRELQAVPLGVPGELWIGGAGVARGYLGRPDLTAERFVPDPFAVEAGEPGGRLYRTGDLARHLPGGRMEVLGRSDQQVKLRGFRIELGEIEAALAALAGVREAVVVVREGTPGDRRLVAYVVGDVGDGEAGALRRSLCERLPEYMVPAAFVTLAALPLTPNGKVDRKALPAPEWQSAGESHLAPRTPAEEILAGIWAELLGLERVGAADHFFALGGHSLLATQVMSRLRSTFGVEMPLRDLFEAPVLADLATRVEAARRSGAVPPAPPLVPVPREGPLPLSFAQQRLWFIAQLEPGSPLYNIPVALRFGGPLSPAVLAASLGEIVRRHEMLRTVFAVLEGSPVQVIQPAAPFGLALIDLSGLPESRREATARTLTAEEAGRPFDLARGPLLRGRLLRLAASGEQADHIAALTLHHIVVDGWSMDILVREVAALYTALSEGRPSPLVELPVQYADFAAWQQSWLHGGALESEISFWRRQLAGLPPLLALPTDRPRPAVQGFRGATRPVRLPAGLARQALTLGRREGATLFMVLLAGFQTLLARISSQQDLAVGTPVAGRTRVEFEGLIGFFVNTLVLRGDLSGKPSFRESVGRVREAALSAHTHQDVPFEKLVQELAPERSLAQTPLFQVMFMLQNAPVGSLEIPGLRLWPMEAATTTAKFDLTLGLAERTGELAGAVEYATDLFDAATIDRLAGHFERLLAAALAAPERAAAELPLLSPAERHHLALESLAEVRPFPADVPLHRLFEHQVARAPAAVAVTGEGEALTYAELDDRAGRLAARLRRLGVGPEVRVALWLDRTVDLVVAILGVLKAGGAYVPIDPACPEDRLRFLLADARSPVLVSAGGLRGRVDAGGIATVLLDRLDEAEAPPPVPPAADLPESTAYVIYTSGSTGKPKGVPVSHANVARLLTATAGWFGFDASDVWTLFHSYAFDFSVWELWGALLHGGRLVVVPYWVSRSPEEFYALLVREQVTVLNQTPSAFHQLAAVEEGLEGPGRQGGPALRRVIFGGEALEPRRLAGWFAHHSDRRPALINMYGITETTVHVTYRPLREGDLERGSVIGVPIPDLYLHVLDGERGPVPLGVAGEIHVGGAGLARGYLGRPELTAERFVPDPFAPWPGARLYASGDLARRRPDSELEYLGRADQQVKIRGFRIEPGEVEAALASQAGVREAVVVVREDTPGDRRLVAYVAGDATDLKPGALCRSLQELLPDHMVPAAFVTLAALPLTPNGKVDRKALPAPERQSTGESHLAPRTPAEEILAGIWAELLGLERVGAADHFFALGGHSLLATQVMSRLRSTFGVEMPLRDLFEAPVLADLATRVEAARRSGAAPPAPPLVPVTRAGPLPLSFAQQRLWFIDQLEPGTSLYNMRVALRVQGPLDSAVLARCLGEIVRRHEALRTVFAAPDGSPVQVIQPATPFGSTVADLSGLPESGREAAAFTLAGEEVDRPFDLRRGPLLRCALLRLTGRDHIVALTLHHIAGDGWSMGILVREIAALYAAFVEGRPSPLPELPVQYADFAVWQRAWLRGTVLDEQLAWWKRQLADIPQPLELPMERPRPATLSSRGESADRLLSPELCRRIEELGRRERATPFMTLLAALAALLHRYTGQDDMVVGTPTAGRTRAETEGLIGFFLNTLALRIDLSGDPTARELLGRVRDTTLGASDHQDVPFELLLEELRIERDLSRTPLFQVVLNWLGFGDGHERIELPRLVLEWLPETSPSAKFDLEIYAGPSAGQIFLRAVYNRELFAPSQIDDLLTHLEVLLAAMAAGAERRLSELPPAAARRESRPSPIAAAGAGFPPEALDHSIPARFAALARAHASQPAVVAPWGTWTYAELAREVDRVAYALDGQCGVREGRIALLFSPGPAMVAAVLGALAAGSAYVPLDSAHPSERLLDVLADSGAGALLAGNDQRARVEELAVGLPVLFFGDMQPVPPQWTPPPVPPEAPAYLLYTSGSTGRPKGVLQSHRNVLGHIRTYSLRLALGPEDRLLLLARYGFDAAVMDLFGALLNGAVLCIWDLRNDGLERLGRWIAEQAVTVYHSTPSVYRTFLDSVRDGESWPALRLVVLGGEAARRQDFERFHEAFPPGCRLVNGLGPTESTLALQRFLDRDEPITRAGLPVGWPVEEVRAWLRQGAGEQPATWGMGEIEICSSYLALGYWGRPDLTAERFLPDPEGMPGARLYRTGDLARRLPEGELEFLGRADGQVKVRGYRIETGEIEAALVALDGVCQAVVVAQEDGSGPGPGDPRLVAYVASDVTVEGLRRALRERLPDYMVPAAFVTLPSLPLTPNGKVDRRALPSHQWQDAEESYLAPRTPVEEVLAGIWAGLLGRERVGVADNFFDLGGHSLLATRVMSRLRSVFDVEMPLRDLFEAPKLEDLAERVKVALRSDRGRTAPPLVPLAPALRQGPLPLSFAQQRLWFIDQLEPGSPLYNMPVALRVAGPLDVAALALCLGEIVRRHEALRTVFAAPEGAPVQVIQPAAPFRLSMVDLSGLPESRCAPAAVELAGAEAAHPFDLGRGPLLRGLLVRLAEAEHIAALTMHHIVSDGWSLGLLVREVTELYAAFAESRPSPLPELPIQYADFAVWQRQFLQGEALEAEVSFWRDALRSFPVLELPTDRPRPRVRTSRGGLYEHRLPGEPSAALTRLARAHGSTLFMVLLAGFAALLSRWTGQDDIVVGSTIANRTHREIERLIGFFVNSLVLRIDGSGDPDCGQILARVRRFALTAFAHQDLAFEKLVEELSVERDPSRTPLFQVLFALQNAGGAALSIPGLTLSPVAEHRTTAKFDLTLAMAESPEGVYGLWEYNRDLFDAATVARMAGHLEVLLGGMLAAPRRRISELPLLGAGERAQLLLEFNDTETPCPQLPLVQDLLAAHARRRPAATALAWRGGCLTYGELDRRADRLARHLRTLGVGPEVLVALCTERMCPERVVGIVAVLKAGGAYVSLDPTYPRERLAFLLADSRAPVVLTQEKFAELLPVASATVIHLDGDSAVLAPTALDPEDARALPASGVTPENLSYVVYTSGSTGRPKGVEIPHSGLMNLVRWHQTLYRVGPEDRGTQVASPAFDASIWELWPYLAAGSSLHIPDEETRLSAPGMLRWWQEEGITLAYLMTPLAEGVLEQEIPPSMEFRVRALIIGGDRLRRGPRPEAGFQLMNHYGPAEYTVTSTVVAVPPEGERRGIPTIGRPIDNTRIHVLDHAFNPVPVGVLGELFVTGIGLARGYLGRPDLTAEKFVPNPFSGPEEPGARIYRTGDLVRYLPDGDMDFQGRLDHQVKLRGLRIELGEIEAMLGQHPSVREATVLVREDCPGDRRLVAYVVAADAPPAADELRGFLAESLPEYMVPSIFVMLEALPLTPNGKVDRKALPVPERPSTEEGWLAPRTPVEEVLAGIWAELLGLERVGAADSFFELGGHSLVATRLMSRLHGAFDVEMPLRDLFDAPTLSDFAARVEVARRSGAVRPASPLAPVPRQGPLPLSFAQQRLWFIDQLEPGSPLYNLRVALRAEGLLDPAVLALTLGEIVRRHEILRTVFVTREGAPLQVIRPAASFVLPLVDLSGLPESGREPQALALAGEEARRPFDLTCGPLLRSVLLRLAEDDHVSLLTLHHIVSDGWSMSIMVREVVALYAAFAEGRPSPLPELPVQYADFAVWQRGWLDREVLGGLVEYWRQRLAGAPPQLDLLGARPRPAALSPRGAARQRRLSPPLLEQLRALGRRESATLFMTLLAPLQALLHSRTGATDLVVGTDVAGRDRRETEGLIGFFINQLPLRADLAGDPTLREVLGRARETALGAYAYQDLPFDHLVESLRTEQSLRFSPVFQVKLVLQNAPRENLDLPGLTLQVVPLSTETAQLDLHWSATEIGEELWLTLTYSTDLYDERLIDDLLDEYEAWLHAFVKRPEARLGDMAAELAEAERARQARLDTQFKSAGLAKLRSRRRKAVELAEQTQEAEVG